MTTIDGLVSLHPSGVRPLFRWGKLVAFRIDPDRAHRWYREGREPKYTLPTERLFHLSWPVSDRPERCVPPLKSLVKHHWHGTVAERAILALSYAQAHPDDRSFRAELARYSNGPRWLAQRQWSGTYLSHGLGQSLWYVRVGWPALSPPMTSYYQVWQHIQAHKKVARLRNYLIAEFNRQVVAPLLEKNGLSEEVEIAPRGFLSLSQLDHLFDRFRRREIGPDDVFAQTEGSRSQI